MNKHELDVAFVVTHYPPSSGFGGVCESGYGLSRALANNGINIKVVTSNASKGERVSFDSFDKKEINRLSIHPFNYFYSERSCFSFSGRRIINEISSQSDLVHINGIYTHPATVGAKAARKLNKPHIIALRNGLDPWMMKIKRLKKMIGYLFYVKNDLKSATCIHATSVQEIDAAKKIGIKGPFTIIPNGISLSEFQSLPPKYRATDIWPILKNCKVVLFMSRLSKQKGLDMLIPVWEDIVKKHPDTILVIAGPDYLEYGKYARWLVSQSTCNKNIIFTGNVVGEYRLALYSIADIFILPSYSENFGNVIAEALACEVPVITTKATPWSEIEKNDCGRWVAVDKNAIYDSLDDLLYKSNEEREAMGKRGKKLISQNYTWDIAARKMKTVYHAMLNKEEIPLFPKSWNNKNLKSAINR